MHANPCLIHPDRDGEWMGSDGTHRCQECALARLTHWTCPQCGITGRHPRLHFDVETSTATLDTCACRFPLADWAISIHHRRGVLIRPKSGYHPRGLRGLLLEN